MAPLHRFYTIFSLFTAILLLASCSGTNKNTWTSQTEPTTDTSQQTTPEPQDVPAPATTVKVAILLPLTGPNAATGQSLLQAAQLAVFDYNNETFQLISRDTGGTSQGAAAAAQSALKDGAQLILGPLLAEEVRAVKSVTAPHNINLIAFSTDWTLAGGNTYMMGFLPFGQVDRIASYAASRGLKRTAVASGADAYGATVSNSFESKAQEKGLEITRALSDPAGYDSVFIPASGSTLTSLLLRVTNKTAQKLGTGLWDDARLAANPAMNGAWFAAPSPTARKAFETRYQATYGKPPVRIASLAYDATALAEKLSGSGFNATTLTSSAGFAGVDGILRFTPSGLAERGLAILEIRNGQITEIDPAPTTFGR